MSKINESFEDFWRENGEDLTCSKIEAKLIYKSGYEKRSIDMVNLREQISKMCSIMDRKTPRIVLDIGISQLKDAMDGD